MKRILFAALCCAITFVACEKEEETTNQNQNNNNGGGGGGGGGGGFTPPTADFWRINGTANSGSAEIVSVNMAGTEMGINRPFPDLGFGYCQLRVFTYNNTINIRNDVPEGEFRAYTITTGDTFDTELLRVELDVQDQNSSTNGQYFYRATGGTIYISKLNGKLRYTASGTLQMEGVKYPNMQDYIYTCQLEFSQGQP